MRVCLASLMLTAAVAAVLGGAALDRTSPASALVSVSSESQAQTTAVLAVQQQAAAALAADQAGHARLAAARLAADRVTTARLAAARVTAARLAAAKKAAAPLPVAPKAAAVQLPVLAKPVVARAVPTAARAPETAAQRGARVLASLHYPWQQLGYRIQFLPDKHGYLGLTSSGSKLIEIYVRSSQSDLVLAHSIAHEIGHALDFTRGGPAKHALYLTTRGLSTKLAWFGCSGCSDYRTPAGDWAEVFAYWLAGPGDYRSQVKGAPDAAQLKALGPLFRI